MPRLLARHRFAPRAALAIALVATGLLVPATLVVTGSLAAAEVGSGPADDPATARSRAGQAGVRIEDLSQRTETTQVFANPDGTWTAEQAVDPVRVEDESGEWHDIDLTLVERDGALEPKYAATDVRLSDGGDKVMAEVSEDSKDLAWKWSEILPEPAVQGATATYADIVPGGDLVVTATTTGFSHSIVLRERPDDAVEYSLPVVTDGAKLTETPQGGLKVATTSGDVVMEAPRPMMWDSTVNAAGDQTNVEPVDVTVTAPGHVTPKGETAGTSPVITLSADQDFLTDPSTVYPVTIDPTFSTATTGDTWIQNIDMDGDQGTNPVLRAGTYDGGTHKSRSFLKFDEAAWAGKDVTSASLVMRNWYSTSCTGAAVRVARLTSSWSFATIAWNNQPTAYGPTTDLNAGYGASGCPENNASWNITGIVDAWNSGWPNFGLRVAALDETNTNTYRKYRSTNYAVTSTIPRISITYLAKPTAPEQGVSPCVAICDPDNLVAKTLTPTLNAVSTDSDTPTLSYNWTVREQSSGIVVHTATTTMTQGLATSVIVPAGKLQDEILYEFSTTASDGIHATSAEWLEFGVDYNSPPAAPTVLTLSPCEGSCSTRIATSLVPVLSAILDDPDTYVVVGEFEVRVAGGSTVIASQFSDPVAPGEVASFQVPDNVLSNGSSYEFRVGSNNLGQTSWSSWAPFQVSVPQGPIEPALALTSCSGACDDWQTYTSTPTFRTTRSAASSGTADVRFEVRSGNDQIDGSVTSVAPGGTADWTVPVGFLGENTYDVRTGESNGTATTWTAWHAVTVVPGSGSFDVPALETEEADAGIETGPAPDPRLSADDTGPAITDVDAEAASLDAQISADVDLASTYRVSPDTEEPEDSAFRVARGVPVWKKYAPLLFMHPYEEHFPLSALEFVDKSRLRWSHNNCKDHTVKGDPTAVGLGHGEYSHQTYSGPCFNHSGPYWNSNEPVRPGEDGGPGGKDGMFLDIDDDLRDGGPGAEPPLTGREPTYVRYLEPKRNVSDGYIEYWFNYGDSFLIENGRTFGHHEGDWERIAIKLSKTTLAPTRVQYFYHHDSCTLRWPKVPKFYSYHPIVWVAKDSHGSYPAKSFPEETFFSDSIPNQIDGHFDSISSSTWRWPTWKNATLGSGQPWWGYRGAWGASAQNPALGGTHGPAAPHEQRGPAGFGTETCKLWSP